MKILLIKVNINNFKLFIILKKYIYSNILNLIYNITIQLKSNKKIKNLK